MSVSFGLIAVGEAGSAVAAGLPAAGVAKNLAFDPPIDADDALEPARLATAAAATRVGSGAELAAAPRIRAITEVATR
jgi:hypothetical protein